MRRLQPESASLYYHADALGSVRQLTDEGGSVVAMYDYKAFGERLPSGDDPTGNVYKFTGEQWDEEPLS